MVMTRGGRRRGRRGRFGLPAWIWLAGASFLTGLGLLTVYDSKRETLAEAENALESHRILNVNAVRDSSEFLPFLLTFPTQAERQFVADQLFAYVKEHRPLRNVGALAKIRLGRKELAPAPQAATLRALLDEVESAQKSAQRETRRETVGLISLRPVKSSWIVRSPSEFRKELALWALVYFAAFYAIHLVWAWRGFRGDYSLLPAAHLLTGMALITMISLRDPLRDTLGFGDFAGGVALGCGLLLWPCFAFFDLQLVSRKRYWPLYASLGLFVLLWVFGRGPEGSDAKVSVFHFQPVEVIKILLVFFLAGYLKDRWQHLRDLREKGGVFARLPQWLRIPRMSHFLPVVGGIATSLIFFFLLKDLGPALITSVVFLSMYGVARSRIGLVIFGFLAVAAGFMLGHYTSISTTVNNRIAMWLSPWNNAVRGGDQVAHALWALATGGLWGSGVGWGDPSMIPRGDDDLILASIGEEWGFIGILTIALVFAFIVYVGFRVARRAASEYAFFLAFGLSTLLAVELMVITAGIAQVLPLTGVVSPFLSLGKSSMICNFLIVAILAELSARSAGGSASEPFRRPARRATLALAVFGALLLARIGYVQVLADGAIMRRTALTVHADGSRAPEFNPRITAVADLISRGDIYDRNGVLLATSDWAKLEGAREVYEGMNVDIDAVCSRSESRHYPFGAKTVHLIGDWRTRANFGNPGASLVERDSNVRLQGFEGYGELVEAARRRRQPNQPALARLLARHRDVHLSIDIRLQLRAADILEGHLRLLKKDKGALVMMDAATGDILAEVSHPWPASMPLKMPPEHSEPEAYEPLRDRARDVPYVPGSSFKLVTAMAALRQNPDAFEDRFECRSLGRGRVGNVVRKMEIRDDAQDAVPHGHPAMPDAIRVSCNAYFAQLGEHIGASALQQAADLLEISVKNPATNHTLYDLLPQAAYGQGEVTATPLKMARVAATVAAGGFMPQGRWIIDESNSRTLPPKAVITREAAGLLAAAMRSVVAAPGGTATRFLGPSTEIAGKTGTAQPGEGQSHAWFVGYAPYVGRSSRTIAFAVIVEHGGYGGPVAAPIAKELIDAAHALGLL